MSPTSASHMSFCRSRSAQLSSQVCQELESLSTWEEKASTYCVFKPYQIRIDEVLTPIRVVILVYVLP